MRQTVSSKAYWRSGTALAGVVGAALLAGIASQPAHAAPAYAYANIEFTNFTLSGLVDSSGNALPGVTLLTTPVVTVTDSANYPGVPPCTGCFAGGTGSGSLGSGASETQAYAGPAGATISALSDTALASYTPQLTSLSGTRGEVNISSPIATGATSLETSEGRLTLNNGAAGSSTNTTTTIEASFSVSAGTTVTLAFNYAVDTMASVGKLGDNANANVTAQYQIIPQSLGACVTGTGTVVPVACGLNAKPDALNPTASQTLLPFFTPHYTASGSMSFTDTLTAGQYELELTSTTTESLTTIPAPEPVSLALLGTGLVGVGMVRRRRRQG